MFKVTSAKADTKILRERLLPITIGLSLIILTVVGLRPLLIRNLELSGKIKDETFKLSDLNKKVNQLEVLDNNLLELKVKQIERVLPSEKPVMLFLDTIAQLADKKGILLGSIELTPGEIYNESTEEKNNQPSILQEMKISFSLTGDTQTTSEFIDELEETAPLMRVEGIAFSLVQERETAGDEEQAPKQPQATLEMKIFYQPLPKELGRLEAPLPEISQQEEKAMAEVANYHYFEGEEAYVPVGKKNPFSL